MGGIWGFLRLGREVGVISPPHFVLRITIEPSKPRLCHEERFLNLWIGDLPFKLDHLVDLPSMFCLSISRLPFKARVDISMFGYIRSRRRTLDSSGIISFCVSYAPLRLEGRHLHLPQLSSSLIIEMICVERSTQNKILSSRIEPTTFSTRVRCSNH